MTPVFPHTLTDDELADSVTITTGSALSRRKVFGVERAYRVTSHAAWWRGTCVGCDTDWLRLFARVRPMVPPGCRFFLPKPGGGVDEYNSTGRLSLSWHKEDGEWTTR